MATVAALAVAASLLGPSVASVASPANKVAFVKKTVSSHDIVISTNSYCPYCRRAKAVFKELKKAPYVVELDQCGWISNSGCLVQMVGKCTVPQVFIHGKHLRGSDDTVEAYESGRILTLLGTDSKDNL